MPFITAASRRGRSAENTSSKVILRPAELCRGIRQLGYSSLVPGMFCVARSPTASANEASRIREGVDNR